MAVAFNLVPSLNRRPAILVELDASQAIRGLVGLPHRILLVGQMLSGNEGVTDTLYRITSADRAKDLFGAGSMLHLEAKALFANNGTNEVWAIADADDGGANAAAGAFVVSGAPTANGTIVGYIGGQRFTVGVTAGETATTIATNLLAAALTQLPDAPVTLSITTPGTVDVTAKHPGAAGNSIDLRVNYFAGEALPAGLTVGITAMSGGTTDPDLSSVIAALGDEWFTEIVMPYTEAAPLNALEAELEDRWGPLRAVEGVAFAALVGDHASLLTFGDGRNSQFTSVMGTKGSPTPPWEWAAAIAGVVAFAAQTDPARPFQTLELKGVMAPLEADRFTEGERNLHLFDGVSTFDVTRDGKVLVERLITTYQENASGTPDESFLDVNTPMTLGFFRFSFRNRFAQKYPRHKLAADGTRFGPGQAVLTPKTAKAEVMALARDWEGAGLLEDVAQFEADLLVERNETDPNRLDLRLPPNLVNQLRTTAAQIQFRI